MSARGEVLTAVHFCQLYLSLSSWAASGSGPVPGRLLGILAAASAVLSRPEAQSSGVCAWPDGMWLWGESPDKHASDSTDLRVTGREPLVLLTSHLTYDSFALPHPYCVPSPVPSWALHGVRHFCQPQLGYTDGERGPVTGFSLGCPRPAEPQRVGETCLVEMSREFPFVSSCSGLPPAYRT